MPFLHFVPGFRKSRSNKSFKNMFSIFSMIFLWIFKFFDAIPAMERGDTALKNKLYMVSRIYSVLKHLGFRTMVTKNKIFALRPRWRPGSLGDWLPTLVAAKQKSCFSLPLSRFGTQNRSGSPYIFAKYAAKCEFCPVL